MQQYKVKSKLQISATKKAKIFSDFVIMAIIVVFANAIISLVSRGFSVGVVSSVIVALPVLTYLLKSNQFSAHYEFCYALVSLSTERIDVEYLFEDKRKRKYYCCEYDKIQAVCYNSQIKCLKIIAEYEVESHNGKQNIYGEWWLFVDDENAMESIIDSLEKKDVVIS